jgi:hypothetical protein
MKGDKVTKSELKLVRINNPLFLGNIGPEIKDFMEKIAVPGITYEGLYAYFAQSVQFGGDKSEFWVAFEGEKPLAFAHCVVRGFPHVGKVYLDFIYNWSDNKEVVHLLLEKYIEFGKRHRALLYEADCINETIFRLFKQSADKFGFDFNKTGHINCIGKKVRGRK